MRLYLLRHPPSVANDRLIFANEDDQGYPLTELGWQQAEEVASWFARIKLGAVYSSYLLRARQLAWLIAVEHGLPLTPVEELREVKVGAFEGLSYAGEHAWRMERYRAVEQAWFSGADPLMRLAGGENQPEVDMRFSGFLDRMLANHAANDVMAAVTHGAYLRTVVPSVVPGLPASIRDQQVDHCTIIELEHDANQWRCVRWGEQVFA